MDSNKTVREVVEEGVQEIVDLLKEYNAINDKFSEPMDDDEMTKLLEKQGEVQEKLDDIGAWDLDSRIEMAMDALRCPPGESIVKVLSGGERRRVALCRLLLKKPDIFFLMNLPTTLMPNLLPGLNIICKDMKGQLLLLPTTVISLTMLQDGCWSLTAAKGFPGKEITHHGLNKNRIVLKNEEKEKPKDKERFKGSSNG